jgi:hypothetical protein
MKPDTMTVSWRSLTNTLRNTARASRSISALKYTFENFDVVVLGNVRRLGWELDIGEEGLGRGAGLEVN